ncbi:MAG: hypothetical protein KAX30_03270, partial [Candidatus Atribacteria bacterium]|nr:hypothetical protein [Candidatus Atribacteria bacterium]
GNIKTEEASTILYGKLKTSEVSTAAGIILYAHTYYTILPTHKVELSAEIKDKNGNNITDWKGDIEFSIVTDPPNDFPVGYINPDPQTIHTINGIASIIFTAFEGESLEGIEKIQASTDLGGEIGVVTDTVNIRVSTGAVSILLSPAEESLPKNGSTAITVTVVKADYETPALEYSGEINLTTSGPGNLSETTITITSGVGTVTLISNGTPGVVEVTASAPDLDMGFTEVTFTGDPEHIKVSADNYSMHVGDSNTITVSIEDINGKEVNFVGNIDLEITGSSIGNGSFDPVSLIFDGTPLTLKMTSTFVASEVGSVIIKAYDINLILTEGYTPYPINISEALIPHYIELYTVFPSVKAGGIETSTITATVYDEDGNKVTNYSGTITFNNSGEGIFSNGFKTIESIPDNGVATVELSSIDSGTATVTVSSYDGLPFIPEGGLQVEFYGEAVDIVLVASPPYIFIGGETCTITATIVDEWGIKVDDYEGTVNFSITSGGSSGEFNGETTATSVVINGSAEVTLQSTLTTGIVTVMAEEDSSPYSISTLNITVKQINLALVDGSIYYWSDSRIVYFNIEIDGPNLNLINMKIAWNKDDSFLNEIGIKTPSTDVSYDRIIGTGNAPNPHNEIGINQILSSGESTIRLTFSNNIENIPIEVTFDINFGEYFGEHIVVVVEL